MSSRFEQKLEEKIEELMKIKEGILTPKELADLITERRVKWMKNNLDEMKIKYEGLPPEEMAYKIIFIEHLQVDPAYSKVTRVSETRIRIDSYNSCPYLDACERVGLETKFVCREIGEQSFQEMIRLIHPKLKFGREYSNIRPFNKEYCEEYIELISE